MTTPKPGRNDGAEAPSRRELLAAAAGAAAALIIPATAAISATAPETGLVLHRGWVLRADDLPRLKRA